MQDVGRDEATGLQTEQREVDGDVGGRSRVEETEAERLGADARGVVQLLDRGDIDRGAREGAVGVGLEREVGDRQGPEAGDAVVDEAGRESRQHHREHGDEGDDGAHEGEPPPGEPELSSCEEHAIILPQAVQLPTLRR